MFKKTLAKIRLIGRTQESIEILLRIQRVLIEKEVKENIPKSYEEKVKYVESASRRNNKRITTKDDPSLILDNINSIFRYTHLYHLQEIKYSKDSRGRYAEYSEILTEIDHLKIPKINPKLN